MPEEVAVFVDFENLRYGLLNNFGQEPSVQILLDKAKKYGRPSVMRAYADFSEHPTELKRQLQVAGIDAIHIEVKRSIYTKSGTQVERVKNAADMVLALDAVIEALEADMNQQCKTFLLVTGDADYIKLVTLLRNKFGQRVVVCGVPGSISADLITAAGEEDPIEIVATPPTERGEVKRALVAMVRKGPNPLAFWTGRIIDQWSQDSRNDVPGTAREKRECIGELMAEGVFERRERLFNGRKTFETVLTEDRAREEGYIE